MSGGKRGATNDALHVLRDDLFVPDSVLHGADGAILVEGAGNLRDRVTGVDCFGSDDAIVAPRKFPRVAGSVEFRSEVGGSRDSQTVIADGFDVIFPDIVSPDLGFAFPGEVRGEETANRAATDDADFQQARTPDPEF